ncbi:hypothetical protein ANN_12394 [Periplaneta americana]|uniref:Reverse transcriptase n=1 Tax=Periplaneta americana TaxID=6978 RepID=A0ABQ8TH07_PERAM|nr:hypothetical protein ANN_12394 [Periplaneta americana]
MDLKEVGYDDREWINLAQDRDRWRAYVRAAMNLLLKCLAIYLRLDLCAAEVFTTRCRHPGCNETETLGHVLGFCRKTELLRNNRHHKARTGIADVLKRRGWEVFVGDPLFHP